MYMVCVRVCFLLFSSVLKQQTHHSFQTGMDAGTPSFRSPKFPDGYNAHDQGACCDACKSDPACTAWVYAPSGELTAEERKTNAHANDVPGANCWPLASYQSRVAASNRNFGCLGMCASSCIFCIWLLHLCERLQQRDVILRAGLSVSRWLPGPR